ncbi:hypothetical protein AGMMS50218_12470 [Actinomycetota bacterium]|nr:hypothetical protein AGMMS50218_12470 [Actinomycetota bacterium]
MRGDLSRTDQAREGRPRDAKLSGGSRRGQLVGQRTDGHDTTIGDDLDDLTQQAGQLSGHGDDLAISVSDGERQHGGRRQGGLA